MRNQNRAIAYSRGDIVKFLHSDDALLPHCLARIVDLLEREPTVGFVFAKRRIELTDESDPNLQRWRRTFTEVSSRFSELGEVNDGRRLFAEWLEAEFFGNWIGEPSSVAMRRSALERTGLFSPKVQIVNDIDLWLRALLHCQVGFIAEELTIYRASPVNLTSGLKANERDWLDLLWMLEGLTAETDAAEAFPQLRDLLAQTRRRSLSGVARTALAHPSRVPDKLRDLRDFALFHLQKRQGWAPRLHPTIEEVVQTGRAPRLVPIAPAVIAA